MTSPKMHERWRRVLSAVNGAAPDHPSRGPAITKRPNTRLPGSFRELLVDAQNLRCAGHRTSLSEAPRSGRGEGDEGREQVEGAVRAACPGRCPRGQVHLDSWGHTGTLAPSMRRQFALLAALPMVLGLTACTKIQSRDLIREGNQAYKNGEFEEAIEKYDESLEIEPGGVTVQWNRAMAAESLVLALKDATDEDKIAERKQYATLALEALDAWNEGRDKPGRAEEPPTCKAPKSDDAEEGEEKKGDPDLATYKEHRLALLGADSRCDDLIEHWRQLHMACPQNEELYMTIASTFEDMCSMPDKADEWHVKRTEDFPQSAKAWYSLATRRFNPLFPDPESGLPFNNDVDAEERLRISDEVIALLKKATAIEPKYRDPYVWRSMAHTQKSLARVYVDPPDTPEDGIQAILGRRDSMLAWRETKAVCDIDDIPNCPFDPDAGQLFYDLSVDPAAWAKREVNLYGHVLDETVKEIDPAKHIWEIDIEISYTPVLGEGEYPPPPPPPPPEGEDPAPKPTKVVTVRYAFFQPTAEVEGEEAPDVTDGVNAQIDLWKRQKSTQFSGFMQLEGDKLVLESKQKQYLGCCPYAPLTPDEEKADSERIEELYLEKRALEAAALEAENEPKKKGRNR